jgi:hypothetical protein
MQRPTRPAVSGGKTYYFRTCLHNTIHRVLQNRPNWVETDSDVVSQRVCQASGLRF